MRAGELLMKKSWVKGQNLVEITIILGLTVLAFVGMQTYVQRGIQGKAKLLTNKIIGDEQRAYSTEEAHSHSTILNKDKIKVKTQQGGSVKKTITQAMTSTKSYSWSKESKDKEEEKKVVIKDDED